MRQVKSKRMIVLLGLALAGGGCSGPRQQAASTREDPAAAHSTPVQDAASIAGQWDVFSFEGYRPKRLNGTERAAFADFDARGVRLRIECNHSGRAGEIAGGRFRSDPNGDAIQTQMGCGPEREARDGRFFGFFDKSPTVERIGADRLRLRAEGAELILERPTRRRLENVPEPNQIRGAWRLVQLTHYHPEGGHSGIGLSDVPGRILIADGRISYSRCPQYGVAVRMAVDGRLTKVGGAELPNAPRDCREFSGPSEGPLLPPLCNILRLLHASPAVERSDKDSLLLSTDRLGLLITRAP